ncbi:MAG: C25 family cysteine peptidase [Anaerolineae bacterium]|nr:C25 family cysteine peptidase [Anaerolineae bacterium]
MRDHTHTAPWHWMSLRLAIVLVLSLGLLLVAQIALSAKPGPGTGEIDDLPDHPAATGDPDRMSAVALPVLPDPAAPITLPATVWRIGIITDGLYALDYATLAHAGVPVTGSNADDFHILWRGEELALDGTGIADTIFEPGDSLIFYAEKFHGSTQDEKYTDENVYWLTVDSSSPGLRVGQRSVAPTASLPAATICTSTAVAEQNLVYWARHSATPGTDTTWFWERIPFQNGVTVTYQIDLVQPVVSEMSLLEVEVAAKATGMHIIRLGLNNTTLGEWTWFGKVGTIVTAVVPANVLVNGSNDINVYTGEVVQSLYFDRAEITYQRKPVAGSDGLYCEGNIDTASTYTFTTVPANARLYDVTDALHPISLTAASTQGQNVTFRESVTQPVTYLAQNPTLATVSEYHPDLDLISPTTGADEIIIAPRHFMDALAPLITQRQNQGLRVRAVAVEDIYPLFNGGIFHPEAIRAFIAHAYANWPGDTLQYLFLVGDGNFNFKGYNPASYGVHTPSLIPPYMAFDDPTQGEVPLDMLFGDIDGSGLPEVMVGRIPAQTMAEVTAYVNKVLNYEAQPMADWNARFLLVADNGNTYDEGFDSLLNRLETNIPSYITRTKVYMEDDCDVTTNPYTACPTATQKLTESWNTGAGFLIYSGHGSINRWAHEPLVFNVDLVELTETTKLPFLLSLDCWDGFWMFPPEYPALQGRDVRSIGEWVTTVLTETGAIANFSPAGLAYAYQQEVMTNAMLQQMFQNQELRLGQLTQAGREVIQYTYLARIMTLFGDPAMKLKIPVSFIYVPMAVRQ